MRNFDLYINYTNLIMNEKYRDIKYVHNLWLRTTERVNKYRDLRITVMDDIIENIEPNEKGTYIVYETEKDDSKYINYYEIRLSNQYGGKYELTSHILNSSREEQLDYLINSEKTNAYADKLKFYDNIGFFYAHIVKEKLINLVQIKVDAMIGINETRFLRTLVINIENCKYVVSFKGGGYVGGCVSKYNKIDFIEPYEEVNL